MSFTLFPLGVCAILQFLKKRNQNTPSIEEKYRQSSPQYELSYFTSNGHKIIYFARAM